MNKTDTDLREEFENVYFNHCHHNGAEGRIDMWDWIQANYVSKSEAISRKDAVSKSEVSRKINELSVDRDGWVKEHIEDLEILLTEVDKPNKS